MVICTRLHLGMRMTIDFNHQNTRKLASEPGKLIEAVKIIIIQASHANQNHVLYRTLVTTLAWLDLTTYI